MTSRTGLQTIAIHLLPYISRSKINQTIKFGQLIQYDTKKIFVEKLYTKYTGETIPKSLCKKSKLSISLDH